MRTSRIKALFQDFLQGGFRSSIQLARKVPLVLIFSRKLLKQAIAARQGFGCDAYAHVRPPLVVRRRELEPVIIHPS